MKEKQNNHTSDFSSGSFFSEKVIFIYDFSTYEIMDVNDTALRKYGFTRFEFLSKKITDLGERVSLSDSEIKHLGLTDSHPQDLWKHTNSAGETWYVQITTQIFRYRGKNAILAIAHDVDHLFKSGETVVEKMPRIEDKGSQQSFGWLEWNKNLEVRGVSKIAEDILNVSSDELVDKSVEELPFGDKSLRDQFHEQVYKVEEDGKGYFLTRTKHVGTKGEKVICHWHNLVVLDEKGELLSIYSLVEDVTSRKTLGTTPRKSESKFRVLSEQSFVGIYILDGTSFDYINPRLCEITEYTEDELLNDLKINDLIHPEDFTMFNRQRKQWEKNPSDSFEISLRIISKTDRVLHVKTFISAIQNNGELRLLGVLIDQTRQVKALENYRASVESYQSLFDCITDSIYIQDENGVIVEANRGVEEMYGYEKDEVIGKDPSFLAATNKVDLKETMRRFQKALEGEAQQFRWWGKRKNGEIFPKEIKLSKGNFFGQEVVIAVGRDITENVKREDELRRNEKLFEQLFRNSPLGIALLDADSNILQVNQSFESLFGYKLSEIKGKDLDHLIVPPEDIESAKELYDAQETFTLSKRRRTKSGEMIDVFIYGVPVVIEGETIAIFGIYMDITDRIQSEKRIVRSLEEKKTLLAEIHHRVKNNLAVITGLLELQYHNLESEEAKSALRDSQMRINSMGLIHEKLYQNESLSDIDFGQYINELVGVIIKSHNKSDKDIDLQFEADDIELPITKAIPCGLIINEIVTNSLKYAFEPDQENPVIRIAIKKEGNEAKIEISDNGIGLPAPFGEIDTNSLGTLLIKTLTNQLNADLTVDGSDGTQYTVIFQLEDD